MFQILAKNSFFVVKNSFLVFDLEKGRSEKSLLRDLMYYITLNIEKVPVKDTSLNHNSQMFDRVPMYLSRDTFPNSFAD